MAQGALLAGRKMRSLLSLLLPLSFGLSVAAGCNQEEGGAVVLRWQLVDQTTGGEPGSCDATDPADGCCALVQTPTTGQKQVCVDEIRLLVNPAGAGATATGADAGSAECSTCRFACGDYEHATDFEITPGDYLLSVQALRKGRPIGYTPPAVARTVQSGEVVDLKSLEVLLTPDSPACGD